MSTAVGMSKNQSVPHSACLFCSQVMLGGVVSTTVTFWLHKVLLPQVSIARQVRVAVNSLGHSPVKTLVTVATMVMVTLVLSHTSIAVGGRKLHGMPHSTIRSSAQVMLGGVVSTTVTFWLHRAKFPQASVARQVRVAV